MRNIIGPPVEGDDFYDRHEPLLEFVRLIVADTNVLQVAARRMGKTSFVLRLCEILKNPKFDPEMEELLRRNELLEPLRKRNFNPSFFSVEGCRNEIDFAEVFVDNLIRTGMRTNVIEKARLTLTQFRNAVEFKRLGAFGLELELGLNRDSKAISTWKLLEEILRTIEGSRSDETIVIAIDELPEFLMTVSRQDEGKMRVERTLHWLRAMRQTYRKKVRWIFLGSIGLDTFVDQRGLRKTINDLAIKSLDGYSEADARSFLQLLSRSVDWELPVEACDEILEQVGWFIPHHLQLVFHALVDIKSSSRIRSKKQRVSLSEVREAIELLLNPTGTAHFETWHQRLNVQFDAEEHRVAMKILSHLSLQPRGLSFDSLVAILPNDSMGFQNTTKPFGWNELLNVLIRDGYISESQGVYRFRSFVLREFWRRKEVIE